MSNNSFKNEEHARPTWDEYFMEITAVVGKRGTCDRGRSGCVVTRNNHILCTGYVGSPVGLPHCDEVGHDMKTVTHADGKETRHCRRTAHAEQNAINLAARHGIRLEGSTMYCNMIPCRACAQSIINAGISRLVAKFDYHTGKVTKSMFDSAGVAYEVLLDQEVDYPDK